MDLDRLPAWGRHLLIAFGSTAGGSLVQSLIDAGGVTGLDWTTSLATSVDHGAVATAVAAAALWGLPITRQYGLFKQADT